MIALWKGKNPIYFEVKGQGYYKYNFWQQGVKIQYTELKLSCGNDPVKNYIYSNGDLGLGEEPYLFWGHNQ
jgi:hypothetical protein